MKNEIDKDFYCSTAGMADCPDRGDCMTCLDCSDRHRKHPTPEQFEEEYGEEYPDDGAVYYYSNESKDWRIDTKFAAYHAGQNQIVCACTPFGCPSKDWRP